MRRSKRLSLCLLCLAFVGCGSATKNVKFNEGYQCPPGARIEVPPAENATGKTFEDIDVGKTLSDELAAALRKEGILAESSGDGSGRLRLPCKIAAYEQGSAFKRWLWPGYGSTVLDVKCELRESASAKVVGIAEARHTVDAGGGYTIGAWQYIFKNLSVDLAKGIREILPK